MFLRPNMGICQKTAILLAMLVVLIHGCTANNAVLSPSSELQKAYQRAVADMASAEPHEIYKDLTALTASNADLIWQGAPGDSRLLTVTWTDYQGYDDQIGQIVKLPIDVWVTAARELQEFCRATRLAPQSLTLRLEQLLGLPPHSGRNRFVELWAYLDDIFRPSPDPEITDHEAELEFPRSSRFVKIADGHVSWFNDWKKEAYSGEGYPWTGLGYTYDWGNPESEVGLSEFVIRQGANVIVQSVWDINQYCR